MKKIILTIFAALFLHMSQALSIPAYPHPVTVKQPDGTEITIYMKGDEKIKWMESMDGYSLLRNKEGYIVYATLDKRGDMMPSDIVARDVDFRLKSDNDFLKNTPKKLFYSSSQVDLYLQAWEVYQTKASNNSSLRGTIKCLCVLMETSDRPFIKTQEDFDLLINQIGYNDGASVGSVRDFYLESTYGNIDMEVTVLGPYMAPQLMTYYAQESNWRKLPEEAAKQANNDIDFSDYDNDGDGVVDVFHVIFSGHGMESGASNAIWSHKSGFWPALNYDGVKLEIYSCSPELRGSGGTNLTTIGVIAHELGHVFGAPDYYDTDYEAGGQYNGTGDWDLMANGSYNGTSSGGCPAHMNMHQKYLMGWVEAVELTEPITITDMPNSTESPTAYFITTTTPNEYYLIENMQQIGFNRRVPSHGLLIYHVHAEATQKNVNNTTHPQQVYPVCSFSAFHIPNGNINSYGAINSGTCPFPGTRKRTEFTDETQHAMWSWAEDWTEKPITNIVENTEKNTVSFDFMGGVVKISELNEGTFKVYPNPASGNVNIQVDNVTGNITATIHDLTGKQVKQVQWQGNNVQNISVQDLASGFYFVKIATDSGEITRKLVIE